MPPFFVQEEHRQREEAYQFMFGVKRADYVSPREFSEVLFQVNIELDDRLKGKPLKEQNVER